jgi:hypothetical protein
MGDVVYWGTDLDFAKVIGLGLIVGWLFCFAPWVIYRGSRSFGQSSK